MRPTVAFPLALLLALPAAASPEKPSRREAAGLRDPAPRLPRLELERYRLPNGLEVILHEDHSTPIVGVNVWYHVGSKNERPGRTGFAHLFEHMMFQGSKHWDDEFFKPLQEAGGNANGSTNTDRTNYYEVVPSNFLERALWLESDRMGFLLDALTQAKLDNQRDVVKNERRQNYENQPYGLSWELLHRAAYPEGHPYSWITIGSQEDLTAATLDDVKDFFRSYYNPSNATLVVAGDFKPAEAKRLVEKYFGALPPGPPVSRFVEWVPELPGEVRVAAQDRVQLPRLYLAWHTPAFFAPGDAELDILSGVLTSGKSSRLYKTLVYERQIAQDVSAFQSSSEIGSLYMIQATARPGHTTGELRKAIDEELERLRAEPPSEEEVQRQKNRWEADFVHGLQQVGGVADRLNLYNHYRGEPDFFQKDLDRYMKVTPADVTRVAKRWLGRGRVVLTIDPMPPFKPAESEVAKGVDRTKKPEGGPAPSLTLPRAERATLGNGLDLVVVEHHELPVLAFNLVVGAGAAQDPPALPGLASLTADLLDEGTRTRDALAISRELEAIGADLSLFADVDSSGAALSTLKRHADQGLALLADVLQNASLPEAELERLRKETLTELLQMKDQPQAAASRAVHRVLYGEAHPYGHLDIGTEAAVEAITRADAEKFYRAHWRPGSSTLVVVGDTTLAEAKALVERHLGGWTGGERGWGEVGAAPAAQGRTVYLIDKPGAAQSVIAVTQVGLPRKTEHYFPALVMNTAFGGMFMSRLNLNLREEKGYSYGARSYWSWRRGAGPFVATAGVQTKYTKESLAEVMRELDELRSKRPLSGEELEYAKNAIVRGFPQGFETPGQIAGRMREIVLHALPPDYFNGYVEKVQAVTVEDVSRVARDQLRPENVAIVVVGDAAVVRKGLEELELGPIVELDPTGSPVGKRAAR